MSSIFIRRQAGFLWIGLMLSVLGTKTILAGTGHGEGGNSSHSGNELITFGPGDPIHFHVSVAPEDFRAIADISRRAGDVPPPVGGRPARTVAVDLVAKEVVSEIAPGIRFHYWTFNETVPGPFIRVRVGDTVRLTLHNDPSSSHEHDIDLHAVNGPGGGAILTKVKAGETKSFQFKALNPGLYVYHCAAGNAPTHIANGMYGLILVEPEGGLPPVDREYYVMQGELYTQGAIGAKGFQQFDGRKMLDERPEYFVFNGRVKALFDHPLKARVGETVRLFVGNGGVSKISSFHVIGEVFDRVWPEGATNRFLENIQTTLIPAGGAAMVEFKVDVPGDYALVDHALSRIDRGAWGLLKVHGRGQADVYSQLPASTSVSGSRWEEIDAGAVRLKIRH